MSVVAELGAGGRQIRQYSLSGRPGADTWQITVKRVRAQGGAPAGAVSSFLHDRVAIGDELRVSPPFGDVSSVPEYVARFGCGRALPARDLDRFVAELERYASDTALLRREAARAVESGESFSYTRYLAAVREILPVREP